VAFGPCGFKSRPEHKRNALNSRAFELKKFLDEVVASRKASNFDLEMPTDKPPYKEAKLYKPGPKSKQQRWCIVYWAWSNEESKLKKQRLYRIPDAPTEALREAAAQTIIDEINRRLRMGKTIGQKTFEGPMNPNILKLVDEFLEMKKTLKASSHKSLRTNLKPFQEFLLANLRKYPGIHDFQKKDAILYSDFLKSKGQSNRTINNKLKTVKTFFIHQVEREVIEKNPFHKIKLMPKVTGKNLAFKEEQVKELMEYMERYPDLRFFARFMYYTLLRTNEIARLKVKNINQYNDGQIYLDKSLSKTNIERHVFIPEPLMEEIHERNILSYPEEYYIFSIAGKGAKNRKIFGPGPDPVNSSRFGEAFREWVLNKLNYHKDYMLYSWKHTGVVIAHRAGVSDADIMQQTGHVDYGSYQVYMKSLGLFAQGDYAAKIPRI
jgi:integrase